MSLMDFREPNQVKWVGVRPGHNGEQVAESYVGGAGVDYELYEVPAGKTFYLCNYIAHFNRNAWGDQSTFYIRDDGDVNWLLLAGNVGVPDAGPHCLNFGLHPLEVPAEYDFYVVAGANTYSWVMIHGWVE